LVGNLINQGADLEDGVDFMFNQIRGSMSLLLLGKEGLYAVRGKYGRTPLALARRKRGSARCVVSETCSFKNLEFAIERFLGPGEMILLTEGKEQQIKSSGLASQLCTFLYVYTGNPAAEYHGVSVKDFRLRSGRVMAKRDKKEGISGHYVAGIPDSGSDYAKGHSNESHTALEEPIVKYTATWQRSYMPPDQKTRDEIALYKLIIIDSLIRGRVGILTEDSIVRGTQLRKLLKNKVLPANPKEIHMRPACPPLLFNCPYLLSTRTLDELFARRVIKSVTGEDLRDVEPYLDQNSREFRRFLDAATRKLGVTTLRYQELGDMIRETRQPENSLCTSCWTGRAIPSN
jgi:amidophosphoribosyltransferase